MSRKIPRNFRDRDCHILLSYTPTPIQEIFDDALTRAGLRLLVKREDLNHPHVSGNKWWKLKYNLEAALSQKKKTIVTFGGAYSNHIFATAAAAHELGIKSVGIIRGEETIPLNSTLEFAKKNNMELYYITRADYRNKDKPEIIEKLQECWQDPYLIPEGGTNELAVHGCKEFAKNHLQSNFDYIFLPVGTGGTMAGIIAGVEGKTQVVGLSVLKNGQFLINDVEKLLDKETVSTKCWSINTDYHFGGYAKSTEMLMQFIEKFETTHKIPLDRVYTGKMFAGIFGMINRKCFPEGSTILAIHTGGLQDRKFV